MSAESPVPVPERFALPECRSAVIRWIRDLQVSDAKKRATFLRWHLMVKAPILPGVLYEVAPRRREAADGAEELR